MTPYKGTRPRKLTPIQAASLVTDVRVKKMKIKDAAVKYGIGERTVYHYLTRGDAKKYPAKPCGTNAAYFRHRRRGEPVCLPCQNAHAAEQLKWREKDPNYNAKGIKRYRLSSGQTP